MGWSAWLTILSIPIRSKVRYGLLRAPVDRRKNITPLPGISASGAFGFGYVTAIGRFEAFLFSPLYHSPPPAFPSNSPPGRFLWLELLVIPALQHIMAARLPLARLSGQRLTTLNRATRATSRLSGAKSLSTLTRSNAFPRASGLLQVSSR